MEPLRERDPRQGDPSSGRRLGGGGMGMGRAFLRRSRSGRPVAVKLVRPGFAEDSGFRRRFALEVEAARRLGGFYTAQVVDTDPSADTSADALWLVTEVVVVQRLRRPQPARP